MLIAKLVASKVKGHLQPFILIQLTKALFSFSLNFRLCSLCCNLCKALVHVVNVF